MIGTKEFFFFGSDSLDPKALATYLRNEKHVQQAQHNISWAAHTGKGLLFVGDKKTPSNVINLVSNAAGIASTVEAKQHVKFETN